MKKVLLLTKFHEALNEFNNHWIDSDIEAIPLGDMINKHYPKDLISFDDLSDDLNKWIKETKIEYNTYNKKNIKI